jgi:acyl carrier protein
MTSISPVTEQLHTFIAHAFPLARNRRIGIDDPLLESGIVDSLGVLQIVGFLEKEFGVALADDDLTPENFRSIADIAELVGKKRNAAC